MSRPEIPSPSSGIGLFEGEAVINIHLLHNGREVYHNLTPQEAWTLSKQLTKNVNRLRKGRLRHIKSMLRMAP